MIIGATISLFRFNFHSFSFRFSLIQFNFQFSILNCQLSIESAGRTQESLVVEFKSFLRFRLLERNTKSQWNYYEHVRSEQGECSETTCVPVGHLSGTGVARQPSPLSCSYSLQNRAGCWFKGTHPLYSLALPALSALPALPAKPTYSRLRFLQFLHINILSIQIYNCSILLLRLIKQKPLYERTSERPLRRRRDLLKMTKIAQTMGAYIYINYQLELEIPRQSQMRPPGHSFDTSQTLKLQCID